MHVEFLIQLLHCLEPGDTIVLQEKVCPPAMCCWAGGIFSTIPTAVQRTHTPGCCRLKRLHHVVEQLPVHIGAECLQHAGLLWCERRLGGEHYGVRSPTLPCVPLAQRTRDLHVRNAVHDLCLEHSPTITNVDFHFVSLIANTPVNRTGNGFLLQLLWYLDFIPEFGCHVAAHGCDKGGGAFKYFINP